MNVKYHMLNKLEKLITLRIIPALDVIITNKHSIMPSMLSITNLGNSNDVLLSNLTHLIDIPKRLLEISIGNIALSSDHHRLAFSKYIHTMMNQKQYDSKTIVELL